MEKAQYDSEEGILKYLETYDGFHHLIRDRMTAGYDRKEPLTEYYILGSWYLDTCGNTMLCKFLYRDGNKRPELPLSLVKSLPKVITRDQLFFLLKELRVEASLVPLPPKSDSTCHVCGQGWSLENTTDYHAQRLDFRGQEGSKLLHVACHRLLQAVEEREYFKKIFEDAGFEHVMLRDIENRYCPCEHCAPWFRVQTAYGTFTIGWRKRVINIDWSETSLKVSPDLFKDQDVTQGDTYIHAYGKDKAVEYLTRLQQSTR